MSDKVSAVTALTNKVTLIKKNAVFIFSTGNALCKVLKKAVLKKMIKSAVHMSVNFVALIFHEKKLLSVCFSVRISTDGLREKNAIKSPDY